MNTSCAADGGGWKERMHRNSKIARIQVLYNGGKINMHRRNSYIYRSASDVKGYNTSIIGYIKTEKY